MTSNNSPQPFEDVEDRIDDIVPTISAVKVKQSIRLFRLLAGAVVVVVFILTTVVMSVR